MLAFASRPWPSSFSGLDAPGVDRGFFPAACPDFEVAAAGGDDFDPSPELFWFFFLYFSSQKHNDSVISSFTQIDKSPRYTLLYMTAL